jgi:hypothetical protein
MASSLKVQLQVNTMIANYNLLHCKLRYCGKVGENETAIAIAFAI